MRNQYLSLLLFCSFLSNGLYAGKVIIMRHGEAQSNVEGVYNTHPKNPGYEEKHLTDKGCTQAFNAGKKLKAELEEKKLTISKTFSSPLPRATETASRALAEINSDHSFSYIKSFLIIENDMGLYDGKPYAEFPYHKGTFPHAEDDLSHNHDNSIQGETLEDVVIRLIKFIEKELKPALQNDSTVLVVTHGTPAAYLSELLGYEKTKLGNAEYVILDVDP